MDKQRYELPPQFHEQIVSLEFKLTLAQNPEDILALMALVSTGIEHYNKKHDQENQNYFIAKMNNLAHLMKNVIDQQQAPKIKSEPVTSPMPVTSPAGKPPLRAKQKTATE
jgi:hypothetical protein